MSEYGDRFKECFVTILADEGGWIFTDDPNDTGGQTFGGMTRRTMNNMLKGYGMEQCSAEKFSSFAVDDGMDQLQLKENCIRCYYESFWRKAQLDEFPHEIDELAFSMVVNLGVRQGVKIIQRTLRKIGMPIKVDGIVGKMTLKAVNEVAYDDLRFEMKVIDEWENKYINLVVSNAEDWRDFALMHSQQKSKLVDANPPTTFRAKYLRGWINRTRKYEERYT